jgi:uncharacterized protein (TIGR00730 family)
LIRQLVEARARAAGAEGSADLVAEILESGLRLLDDRAGRLDVKVIHAALKEMRQAARVFAPWRSARKVSVFGSARTREGEPEYQQAVAFGAAVVKRGFMVITGGGDGIMGAAQRGAGRKHSFGLNIRLPFEQAPNEEIAGDPKLVNFKYFFTRKLTFLKEADGLALFPGGFGTHDEGFESLTLMQTGKETPKPLVFVDRPRGHYWKTWWRFVEDQLLDGNLISKEDMGFLKVTDDVEEAADEIARFYRNYVSMRSVKDRLVLRVKHPVTDGLLAALGELFGDLCRPGGKFASSPPLAEEEPDEAASAPHRIVFPFNRSSYGRLRALIDLLNKH